MGNLVLGTGYWVLGTGFWVLGVGFKVQGLRFKVATAAASQQVGSSLRRTTGCGL